MTITASDVLRVTRQVVAENPLRTNNGLCRYARWEADGKPRPNCIAAAVLTRLGVPIDHLATHENWTIEEIPTVDDDTNEVIIDIDGKAITLLREFQKRADDMKTGTMSYGVGHTPWGVVLKQSVSTIMDMGLA